jgi:hypothetical protein
VVAGRSHEPKVDHDLALLETIIPSHKLAELRLHVSRKRANQQPSEPTSSTSHASGGQAMPPAGKLTAGADSCRGSPITSGHKADDELQHRKSDVRS